MVLATIDKSVTGLQSVWVLSSNFHNPLATHSDFSKPYMVHLDTESMAFSQSQGFGLPRRYCQSKRMGHKLTA
jgi:hypothetical protein